MAPATRPRTPLRLPQGIVLSALLFSLVALAVCTASTPPKRILPHQMPLTFDSEKVCLFIQRDSLEVQGLYHYICTRSGRSPTGLFYPYAVDSLLGGARAVGFEYRFPGENWLPLQYEDVPSRMTARLMLPSCRGEGFEVRAVYRQALLGSYACYIVTTTRGWERPLRSAVFEIHLPEGAEPVEFSFPFEKVISDGGVVYRYEATDFMPDRDITVTWKEE
jgi:hypothetical protein